jgi:SNF2 family DNA or RNA helicase
MLPDSPGLLYQFTGILDCLVFLAKWTRTNKSGGDTMYHDDPFFYSILATLHSLSIELSYLSQPICLYILKPKVSSIRKKKTMGRTKSIPTQQSLDESQNTYHHEPMLGRRLMDVVSSSRMIYIRSPNEDIDDANDEKMIDENDTVITRHAVASDNVDAITDTNLSEVSIPSATSQQSNKRQRRVNNRSDTSTTQDSLPPSTYASNLTSLVQRIENEEVQRKKKRLQQNRMSNNTTTINSSHKTSYRKRHVKNTVTMNINDEITSTVTFSSCIATDIPPIELQIIHVVDDVDNIDGNSKNQSIQQDEGIINTIHMLKDDELLEAPENPSKPSEKQQSIGYYYCYINMQNRTTNQHSTLKRNDASSLLCTGNCWILKEYVLPTNFYIIHSQFNEPMTTGISSSSSFSENNILKFPIVTKQGVIDIYTFIIKSFYHNVNSYANYPFLMALGRTVEAGTLQVTLLVTTNADTKQPSSISEINNQQRSSDDVRLQIALTDHGVECCQSDKINNKSSLKMSYHQSSRRIPSILRKKRKYRTRKDKPPCLVNDLHMALALIYPNTEIADIFGFTRMAQRQQQHQQASGSTPIITAQHVYSLTDNVQLNKAYLKAQANIDNGITEPSLSIPGLLPKLRPYQCKAVEWMLQREQQQFNIDNPDNKIRNDMEWELAWIVLSSINTITLLDNNVRMGLPMSLPQWRHLQRKIDDTVLLFCPYTGWLTTSIQQAQEWTIGSSSNLSTSGGILAESMGLGKTVEVLACILANPRRPTIKMTDEVVTSLSSTSIAKRQLDFSRELMHDNIEESIESSTNDKPSIAYITDMNDFCEAESDFDDDRESPIILELRSSEKDDANIAIVDSNTTPSVHSNSCISNAVQVTPTKGPSSGTIPEIWTDNDIIGSCICGTLIGFGMQHECGSIIVCSSCNEPMHMDCAAFDSMKIMKSSTSPRRYRHINTKRKLDCRVCDKQQCPCCVADIVSGATLIVTPPAILHQWEREIHRHTLNMESHLPLRVVFYDGIKRLSQSNSLHRGSSTIKYMHPCNLADADIVLMTFDALMNDLGHTDDNQFVSRGNDNGSFASLRKRKRYRIVPSPLLSIKWWRVCLDEAQRVETPTASSAQMALKLDAVHRWCVSGTPIQRGNLNDLYGLLLFLRLDPFWDAAWFKKCFNPEHRNIDERIKHLLKNVFWRSTKNSELVRSQMGIPEQIERKIMLKFSSIERHFYERQLEKTILSASNVRDSKNQSSKRSLTMLTDQLHKLRAACCHPQVGSSGIAANVSSRVLTMSQILDKFIDDARTQCEEALRLAILHTNGMAASSKLTVEAKVRGVSVNENDFALFEKCCNLYNQSLQLADENAIPTIVLGNVILSGSQGFRTPEKTMEKYSFCMEWQKLDVSTATNDIWAKLDVNIGSPRKLTQVNTRSCRKIPDGLLDDSSPDFKWYIIFPKDCIFQCMTASGEFTDVCKFTLPHPDISNEEWNAVNEFRINKSKSWRLIVNTFHPSHIMENEMIKDRNCCAAYIGIEIECYEATIANDPLQRLHCLHNASQAYSSLSQLDERCSFSDISNQPFDKANVTERINSMSSEALKIESQYLDSARAFHKDCHRRLVEAADARVHVEGKLLHLGRRIKSGNSIMDCWDDLWWDDFLVACHLYGNEVLQQAICDRLRQDLDGMIRDRLEGSRQPEIVPFQAFGDITGLRLALQLRIQDIRIGIGNKPSRRNQPLPSIEEIDNVRPTRIGRFKCTSDGHNLCMQSILALTESPNADEIFENSRCHVCKADWYQTGPKCRHCTLGDTLEDLTPDKVTLQVLNALHNLVKGNIGSSILALSESFALLIERAKTFFEVIDVSRKERVIAYRLWRTHLNLLNDIDELSQCKSTMRLTLEGEDVTALTKEQLNGVIEPVDVNTSFHHHGAMQAMALGALSRAKGTLTYLTNLRIDECAKDIDASVTSNDEQICLVCLSKFDSDRAVLRCGHYFHLSPCLEKLRSSSGGSTIRCPLRCTTRTCRDEVMIASDGKSHYDGSHSRRRIRGSFGTKVTQLVSDVLDICSLGEKGVVFSQWDDMLEICEQAFNMNGINVVRVGSMRKIGQCTQRFREPDCSVMLLNVKNGAEGLTLIEATHVFMVEPLLNCGLDSQGTASLNLFTHVIFSSRKPHPPLRYEM